MHPEELAALDSTSREKLAWLGKQSTYFMARAILGYDKLVPHVHRVPCDFFDEPPGRFIGHLAPRDHYKTTLGQAYLIRRVVNDSSIRILIANQLADNSKFILGGIKNHFQNNQKFRALYPAVIPKKFRDQYWSTEYIQVPRDQHWNEPTITAVGTGTKLESRHYNLLHLDDIIGRAHKDSSTLMKEAIDWMKYTISLLVEPERSEVHVRGTRWKHDDVYQFMMDKMGFQFLIQKAIVRGVDGPEPLFPELISMDTLRQIIETDPEQYATNYANDPFDADLQQFDKDWLRYYWLGPDGDIRYKDDNDQLCRVSLIELATFAHFDPALADDKRNDPIACVTVGLAPGPKIFVLEAYKKRIDPTMQAEKLIQIQETFYPQLISIESAGYQKALRYFTEKESVRRGVHLNIKDFKPSRKQSKHSRIRARLQPLFRTGSIFLRSDMVDLIDEYLKFGMTDEDHLMDALAQGPEFWQEPWNPGRVERWHKQQEDLSKNAGVTGYGI